MDTVSFRLNVVFFIQSGFPLYSIFSPGEKYYQKYKGRAKPLSIHFLTQKIPCGFQMRQFVVFDGTDLTVHRTICLVID